MKGKIDRSAVYAKYQGLCAYCGVCLKYNEMQVDHIIPQSDFTAHITNGFRVPDFLKHLTLSDLNHIDNLNPSCRVCNKWKSTFHLELFRSELQEQIKRLNLRSANYRMAKLYGQIQENPAPIKFYFETVVR